MSVCSSLTQLQGHYTCCHVWGTNRTQIWGNRCRSKHASSNMRHVKHLAQAEPSKPSSSSTTSTTDVNNTSSNGSSSNTALNNSSASQQLSTSILSTPQKQAAAFTFLSVTSLAFGAAALVAPELLLSAALGSAGTPLDVAFCRIAGATMAISAAVEYSIQDAVTAGHLQSATYQRLMVAVIAKSSMYLAAFLLSRGLWNPVLCSFYPTAAVASIMINVATLQSAFQQSGAADVTEGLAGLGGFSMPKTTASWVYSVFILLYIATVAACYAPEVIFTGQNMTAAAQLLKLTWAPGFLLAAAACWVLKDAADRGRLGASTFRRLNLGLAAVEGGYTVVFGASIFNGLAVNDGSSWSNLVGSIGISLYCLYQYVSTSKPAKY